jgi:dimethylglycine dehydrogenase
MLRVLAVEAETADATGNEPIFDLHGKPAGRVSSGTYGYHVGQSLALAYLRPDIGAEEALEVMILGRPHRARVLARAAFDPEGLRLRM